MERFSAISTTFASPILVSAVLGVFMGSPTTAHAAPALNQPESKQLTVAAKQATTPSEQRLAGKKLAGTSAIAQSVPPSVELANPEADPINPIASLDPITTETAPADGMEQVTSVSQLKDVKPTDWAFQALQSLVERYGCIAGYPDRTFRGNQSLSRYEFAAGVNACMDRISELIASSTADLVKKEDLDALKKLMEEFAAELSTLKGRTTALEARTTTLEKQQFSTTTKLFGQAIVGVQARNNSDIEVIGIRLPDDSNQANVITNVQLSLFTQFSERSILLTGLQAGSGRSFGALRLTNDSLLGYEGDTNSSLFLSDLTYRQLFGNNFALIVGPVGVNMVNVFRGANRIESAGQGPISRFAQRNPILNINSNGEGAGVGFDWQINPRISLQGVYFANDPENPTNGLFGGTNGGITFGAQLTVSPTDAIDIALNYVNAYSPSGFLGTGVGDDQLALPNVLSGRAPINTNAFGGTISWRISPKIIVGGWGGFTSSNLKDASGNVQTVNWMAFLNLPDFGGKGNLLGLYVGQPPRITKSDLPTGRNYPSFVNRGDIFAGPGDQPASTTHLEAFYRVRISDNISITPGVIFVFNPNRNANNENITIGVLRTTFTF